VVEVAGEGHLQARGLELAGVAVLEVAQAAEGVRTLGDAVDPARLGGTEDDPVVLLHVVAHLAVEVVELRLVDVPLELDVDPPQPPVVRQLDGEIAPALPGLPAAEPPLLAE